MFSNGDLIRFALGEEEARKVDTAIPQGVFDQMRQVRREHAAGWYYDNTAPTFGRLLTTDECWGEIRYKVRNGKLQAMMLGTEIGYVAADWPCFHEHVIRGEIQLQEAE